jgi:hypothetical protein
MPANTAYAWLVAVLHLKRRAPDLRGGGHAKPGARTVRKEEAQPDGKSVIGFQGREGTIEIALAGLVAQ